jgi:hypothetical protein
MARFKFCQLSIEIVLLARRLLRDYHNFPVPADLDAGDVHTRCSDGLDGPSQVSLTEAGRPAGHDAPPPLALRHRRVVFAECVIGLPWCCL